MKLKAYDKDDNIIDVNALYFDGYLIAERMLEGLVIQVAVNPHGELIVSANWPKEVDQLHWEHAAISFALQRDVFSTTPELDNDDGFIEQEPST